jgi:dipeptidyl-peptidase-4
MLTRRDSRPLRALRSAALLFVAAAPLAAQQPRTVTATDYDRAAHLLGPWVNPLVVGGTVAATWLPDDRFYYKRTTTSGTEWVIVDPAKRTRTPLFDNAAVATALGRAGAGTVDAKAIPAQAVQLLSDGRGVAIEQGGRRYVCDAKGAACTVETAQGETPRAGRRGRGAGNTVPSPDGKRVAFIRDWNLWVRDVATRKETQLTTDGVKDFGYATDNAGWVHSDRAILKWSPDSRKIATQQQDERKVGDMYLVDTRVGHPKLQAWKYPLPGDSVVAMIQRVIIDVDAAKVIRLQAPPDFHRAMLGDDLSMDDLIWSPDGSRLAYVSTSRDHKSATLKVADAATGAVRTVLEEAAPTQYESRTGYRVLWPTNEVVWYSQRDNWGNLYLYDLSTGALKNRITTGEGPVETIARLDSASRTLWVEAYGREKGQDPYFSHLYRVGLDGRRWTSLTPDDGDHAVQLSPSGRWIIDTYSKPDVAPVAVLRDANGRVVMPLETTDLSKLLASGWKPPMPITVKARDGKTDLYGLLFRPTNFDPAKKYPIINNAYPGPQTGSVGSRSFRAAHGDAQGLADLGFVVVQIDGMGTPYRSKAFHDAYYGAMGRDNTIPDQIAGMKELASRYSWIDIDRAAMWGHSGGGFITADAMFRYPDFFKVGIAESGNHDQRNYEDDWGERYQGLLERSGDSDNYAVEANQLLAKNLKGKLLLAHGTVDDNVPPSNTMLLVDALIKANKDFDLLLLPNQPHGYGSMSGYMMRKRWDYFVKNLLGAEPPKEYEIPSPPSQRPVM